MRQIELWGTTNETSVELLVDAGGQVVGVAMEKQQVVPEPDDLKEEEQSP